MPTNLRPHCPLFLKRFAAWLFVLTHDDEMNEISFYVRYRLEAPVRQHIPPEGALLRDVVKGVRDDRLRALGALDVMERLGLSGR